ncbi:hypothetical protein V8F20_005669 [Naviculisporaceae sp. PSN 640]
MRFARILLLVPFMTLVLADYNLWYRACGSGLAKLEIIAASDRQGPCGDRACLVEGQELGAGDVHGGNPCNGKCQDNLIYRLKDEKAYDIIVGSTNIKVGECKFIDRPSVASCINAGSECTLIRAYRCITYYCHEPAKRDTSFGKAFVA